MSAWLHEMRDNRKFRQGMIDMIGYELGSLNFLVAEVSPERLSDFRKPQNFFNHWKELIEKDVPKYIKDDYYRVIDCPCRLDNEITMGVLKDFKAGKKYSIDTMEWAAPDVVGGLEEMAEILVKENPEIANKITAIVDLNAHGMLDYVNSEDPEPMGVDMFYMFFTEHKQARFLYSWAYHTFSLNGLEIDISEKFVGLGLKRHKRIIEEA